MFNEAINAILGINISARNIYQSKGFKAHLLKRRHFVAANYVELIPEIILNPDYVGKSGEDTSPSIEYVKSFSDDNMRLVVKADVKDDTLYVATMFELPTAKLERFVHSGRFKKYIDGSE